MSYLTEKTKKPEPKYSKKKNNLRRLRDAEREKETRLRNRRNPSLLVAFLSDDLRSD